MRAPGSRILLVLIALLMRLVLPSGFMLDAASASSPTLIACDGQGPLFAAPGHAAHQHHHGPRGAASHGDCPFSSHAGHADKPADAIAPPATASPSTPAPTFAARPHYRPAPAAPAPPSTGPPALV